ncbi:MAG TPA: hypothetical protein VFX98_13435 [Longimicrobiaceae bacterium]|nr:hypothetical protein [Longimicrobiaceae bacterium]
MAEQTTLTDAERARLEQRRARLMKVFEDADGPGPSTLDPDDRADLMQEWTRIDNLLQRSR